MTEQQEPVKWAELTPEQRDALVAEKVMGLRVHRYLAQHYGKVDWPEVAVIVDEEDNIKGNPERYTQSMDAAWSVLLKMTETWKEEREYDAHGTCYRFADALFDYSDSCADGEIWPMTNLFKFAREWTPERICIAALRAVGVQVDTSEKTGG